MNAATVLQAAIWERTQTAAQEARRAEAAIEALLDSPAFARRGNVDWLRDLKRLEGERDDALWALGYWRDVSPHWFTTEFAADIHGWRVILAVAES